MNNFTIEFVNQENERLHKELRKKYKNDKAMLSAGNEIALLQETIRGLYVMEKWQREGRNGNPLSMLRFYSMPDEALGKFTKTYLQDFVQESDLPQGKIVRTEKRKNKWGAFDSWAKEHQGEQFTTEQLVEVAGFSYQTVLKYVSESLLFTKIKKGLWEITNIPKRER